MSAHEDLCPAIPKRTRSGGLTYGPCGCELIREVRIQMSKDGWMGPEAHEAVVQAAKARAHLSATTEAFEKIEALKPYEDGRVSKGLVLHLIEDMGIYSRRKVES